MSFEKTVLVISDKPEQFDPAVDRFRSDGYCVRFEKAQGESVSRAYTENPQLIISELAVPDIDGLKLCIKIRRNENLVVTPILLVGDLSKDSSIVSDAMRCGATNYLERPFDDEQLLKICREMTGYAPQEKNLFDVIIENISDAITIMDDDGVILYGSPSACKILQYDQTDLLGSVMFDGVHPDDIERVREYFSLVRLETVHADSGDYRFRQNDGGWKLIRSIGRRVYDERFGQAIVVTSRENTAHPTVVQESCERLALADYFETFDRWPIDKKLLSRN